jgi:PAS domain S-box-containing protein
MELKDRLRDLDLPLQESEETYRDFFELSRQIPWIADPEGTILWGGSAGTSLTGMAFGEAVGNGWEAAVHPDDRPYLRRRDRTAFLLANLMSASIGCA